jgi:hypothetical protein
MKDYLSHLGEEGGVSHFSGICSLWSRVLHDQVWLATRAFGGIPAHELLTGPLNMREPEPELRPVGGVDVVDIVSVQLRLDPVPAVHTGELDIRRHIHVGLQRVEVVPFQRLISVKRTLANIHDAGAEHVEGGITRVLLETQFGIEHGDSRSQNPGVEGYKPTQIDVDP